MSRKLTKIDPKRAERVKKLIENEKFLHPDEKITQEKIAHRIGITQQNLSRIINQEHGLNENMAKEIVNAFSDRPPKKQYRIQWLLGLDDYMTLEDMYREKQLQQLHDTDSLLRVMTDLVELSGFCVDEDIITTDGLSFVHYMSFSREDGAVTLPLADFREFGEEIRDYVEMRLKRMIEQCQKRRDQ